MTEQRTSRRPVFFLLALAIASALAAPASGGRYVIRTLASVGFPPGSIVAPEINSGGTAAFFYRFDGSTPDVYLNNSGGTFLYHPIGFGGNGFAALNNNDEVAFIDWNGSGNALQRGNGVIPTTTIAVTGPDIYNGDINAFISSRLDMNDSGVVVCVKQEFPGGVGTPAVNTIFTAFDSATHTVIADTGGSPFVVIDNAPSINAAGKVAFKGTTNAFPNPYGLSGVYLGDGTTLTTVEDHTGPFAAFSIGPDVNDADVVAFIGLTDAGDWGVYVDDGTAVTTIADQNNGFNTFGNGPYGAGVAINNPGDVVFLANDTTANQGIFDGPDPIADKVIGYGDALLGGIVADVEFHRGFNDDGQIVFGARIDYVDGSIATGVFRADPVVAGDVDADGDVDIVDFLALLASWGPCPVPCPPICPADGDEDCVVGINDFLTLLANWGP